MTKPTTEEDEQTLRGYVECWDEECSLGDDEESHGLAALTRLVARLRELEEENG